MPHMLVTPVPERGVAGLQAAFHVGTLFEIRDDLRQAANCVNGAKHSTKLVRATTREQSSLLHCSDHVEKGVELFCNSCAELTCVSCVTRGGRHRSHDHEPIGVEYQQDVAPLLVKLDENLSTADRISFEPTYCLPRRHNQSESGNCCRNTQQHHKTSQST